MFVVKMELASVVDLLADDFKPLSKDIKKYDSYKKKDN